MKNKIQMKKSMPLVFLMLVSFISCSDDDDSTDAIGSVEVSYNFNTNLDGWEADFADYREGDEASHKLEAKFSPLPEPLSQKDNSFKLSGNNPSDDVFMFIKRKITDLEPNRNYELTFELEFATNAPDNSGGVGGSPAGSVYIKAGASQVEPDKKADSHGDYRMNIDKGNQASEGKDMTNLGDFSNGSEKAVYT